MNLIERLETFKENHLLFTYNYSIEFSNNTSERELRQSKNKISSIIYV